MNELNNKIDELLGEWGVGMVVCAACKHDVYSHYWNGAGNSANGGWDTCKTEGCKCEGEWDDPEPNTIDSCDWIKRKFIPSKSAHSQIEALITEQVRLGRIDEVKNFLSLLDEEFAYYAGGKPYTKATGTVSHTARVKKIADDRLAQLKSTTLLEEEK